MTSTANLMCNNATLRVYVPSQGNPWNIQKVNHLYRRAAFGATPEMLKSALEKTPSQLVEEMIEQSKNARPRAAPKWANWTRDQFSAAGESVNRAKVDWQKAIVDDFDKNKGGLNDRLTLFWSNILVASYQGYYGSPLFYRYHNILQRNASGNFKDFVHEVGTSAAMLYYLNGYENEKGSPNENYARELLELFTLGVDNGYTQEDIVEIARALTGWNRRTELFSDITFVRNNFDAGSKTFFGRTGNWGYDDVIDILFEERELKIARYICKRIYIDFVSPEVNETIVNQLANTFRNNNFEILPVIERLLKSEHFFDAAASSVIIKSPIDLEIFLRREMNLNYRSGYPYTTHISNSVKLQNQSVLEQASVEGWQGDRDWVNPATLINKWEQLGIRLNRAHRDKPDQFMTFLNGMLGSVSNDVEFVTRSVLDFFFSNQSIDEITYQGALVAFKDNVPKNYFEDGSWNTSWGDFVPRQMYKLMLYIIRIPEFQLK